MSIYKEPPPGMFVVPDPHDMTKVSISTAKYFQLKVAKVCSKSLDDVMRKFAYLWRNDDLFCILPKMTVYNCFP